jgi:ABC-type uncharacterized transport system substrate-binding protein
MRRREFISLLGGAVSVQQRAGALLILSSPLFGSSTRTVAELALRRNLPGITLFPDFARAGGLLAYGPNLLDMYRQSGVMIGKVLQGRKPADLPIERPTQFQLVVNLRTARTLGVTIPTPFSRRLNDGSYLVRPRWNSLTKPLSPALPWAGLFFGSARSASVSRC